MAFPLAALLGLLGGGIGGAAGLAGGNNLSKFFMGNKGEEQQFQKFTPEQQSALDQLLKQGSESSDFSGIENLAQKRFQEETIPSIAERFTSMGAGGQGSSAFQSSLGRAGSDLESQLAGLRSQHGMQQLQMGLQPRFDTGYKPESQGFLGSSASSLMSLLPLLLKLGGGN